MYIFEQLDDSMIEWLNSHLAGWLNCSYNQLTDFFSSRVVNFPLGRVTEYSWNGLADFSPNRVVEYSWSGLTDFSPGWVVEYFWGRVRYLLTVRRVPQLLWFPFPQVHCCWAPLSSIGGPWNFSRYHPWLPAPHFWEKNKSGIHIEKCMEKRCPIWESNLRPLRSTPIYLSTESNFKGQ